MSDELREKALGLPMLPGVYIMKDKQSRVIYVGKATRLKNRVSSYFIGTHDGKTEVMVSKVADFDVIIANTEFEALVLENSLIKHHMPRYNIKLRDDKGYPYIRVDMREAYPSFKIVSKPGKDGALYLGPYSGRYVTREAIGAVCKALKLPTCGKDIKRIVGKERPCLNAHIGTCRAYCQDPALAEEHMESVQAAIDVFQGKTAGLIEKLTTEMDAAAESLSFEIAADKRDRLRAVQTLEQKQLVIAGAMADTDVVGFFRGPAKSCMAVLHFIDGKLISKDVELFDTPLEDDPDAVSAVVRQYYEIRGAYPKAVLLPVATPDMQLLEKLFTEKAGKRVSLSAPQRGDRAKLIETANVNAREEAERATTHEEKTLKTLEWLRSALKLDADPERIEAFDVSNTSGTDIVASMTVFVRCKPYKKGYLRFKIKTVQGQDDYHSMEEAVSRRMAHFVENDEKFSELPNLMLIDGGAVHAAVARSVLERHGVSLPIFGMVKDDKHRTRALVSPDGEEIGLTSNPAAFAFIGTVQEETHRFAIEYHRALRSKNSYKSKLDAIEGIGEKRRNDLLKSFGSLKAVGTASQEELSKVVPRDVAQRVFEFFHK
ncbi:MAG: excinuclease ABC subunit UvrC [Oscillospiraceae bacterium]|nr:excinuclease ABC subunit UvrC [Oscillospiraceae bacterium]